MPHRAGASDLHISENETFQRREWLVQRVAWAVFVAILVAAALGLLGGGPLSHATAAGDGFSIEYERFARRHRPIELTLRIGRAPADSVGVEIAGPMLADSDIERIRPAPTRETAVVRRARFEFAASAGEPVEVSFRLTPQRAGRQSGSIRVEGVTVSFSMLVYP